ncbi:hypothetical protein F5Y16DRAFT_421850 [Xylariaceae sp. FL0255]|nr:hypothetical protein F5Y16DRAFT_421850 [Xylariaceae sp. FL0255]
MDQQGDMSMARQLQAEFGRSGGGGGNRGSGKGRRRGDRASYDQDYDMGGYQYQQSSTRGRTPASTYGPPRQSTQTTRPTSVYPPESARRPEPGRQPRPLVQPQSAWGAKKLVESNTPGSITRQPSLCSTSPTVSSNTEVTQQVQNKAGTPPVIGVHTSEKASFGFQPLQENIPAHKPPSQGRSDYEHTTSFPGIGATKALPPIASQGTASIVAMGASNDGNTKPQKDVAITSDVTVTIPSTALQQTQRNENSLPTSTTTKSHLINHSPMQTAEVVMLKDDSEDVEMGGVIYKEKVKPVSKPTATQQRRGLADSMWNKPEPVEKPNFTFGDGTGSYRPSRYSKDVLDAEVPRSIHGKDKQVRSQTIVASGMTKGPGLGSSRWAE